MLKDNAVTRKYTFTNTETGIGFSNSMNNRYNRSWMFLVEDDQVRLIGTEDNT